MRTQNLFRDVAVISLLGATAVAQNVALQWNSAALQGVRDSKIGPPMVARALAIVHTCMYNAWAAYDEKARPTEDVSALRRKIHPRGQHEIDEALSYAAYRATVDLFPGGKASVFDPLLTSLGLNDNSANFASETNSCGEPAECAAQRMPGQAENSSGLRAERAELTPEAVGNLPCTAVPNDRHNDRSNQLGNMTPSGVAYADWTGYVLQNPPSTMPVNWATGPCTSRHAALEHLHGSGRPGRHFAPLRRHSLPAR